MTVAEEGTSSVGDLEWAGLDLWPSAGGSTLLGVVACCPSVSVKVTDLFWSPCAVGTHARARGQNRDRNDSWQPANT